MQFKQELAPCFWKHIVVGQMMVTELIFRDISMGFQKFLSFGNIGFPADIKIQIAKLTIFGNRIAGSKADSLKKDAVDSVVFKKGDRMTSKLVNLIIIQHHAACPLEHGRVKRCASKRRQDKGNHAVLFGKSCKVGQFFRWNGDRSFMTGTGIFDDL